MKRFFISTLITLISSVGSIAEESNSSGSGKKHQQKKYIASRFYKVNKKKIGF